MLFYPRKAAKPAMAVFAFDHNARRRSAVTGSENGGSEGEGERTLGPP
jgi:hypothetical protein